MQQPQQTLTAAQRLDRLEDSVYTVDQALGGQARVLNIVRDATRLLGKKTDAMVSLLTKGIPVTNDNIAQEMEDQSVEEMIKVVEDFKKTGNLVASETITPETMFVARELNTATGKVTKKRIQTPFLDVEESVKPLIIGKAVGDIVKFDDVPYEMEILEIYTILEAQVEAPVAPTSAETDTPSVQQ